MVPALPPRASSHRHVWICLIMPATLGLRKVHDTNPSRLLNFQENCRISRHLRSQRQLGKP